MNRTTRAVLASDALAFFGSTAVVVFSIWWAGHLPDSHIAPWMPIQFASISAIPFIVSGLPTWIDPDHQVVVSGPGGRNIVVTWPRAKGRKRALIGIAIFVVVTLTGAIANRVVNGPIVLDESAVTNTAKRWFELETRTCGERVWKGDRGRCQLVYRASAGDRFEMDLELDDVICVRDNDQTRSGPFERCIREVARNGDPMLADDLRDVLDYVGETEIVFTVWVAGRSAVMPLVERE
jgi:hypothetical protein